ncbi:Sodium/calcium exchanger protein-domain-containing protein [Elsinoe ampelina]|uniref:Sodium/calcium exchanger protein-domain-containing protein n=1 Tax=Elsinoe ampelina TaxID=302913 RepID=A0A6A6GMT3_9PEZI|nr:Sodium/calcium exchanger protein-domain-containing protein [Elsinoe ampelina]
MHTIRSSARREAWKYYDGESRNYNPFARSTRSGQRPANDEEALRTVRTADSIPSQLEADRRAEAQQQYPHPDRAGTAPAPQANGHDHHHRHTKHAQQADASTPQTLVGSMGDLEKRETPAADPANASTSTDATAREREPSMSRSSDQHNEKPGLRKRMMGKLHRSNTADTHESGMSESKKRRKKHIPIITQLRAVFLGSWINILLLAVPASFAVNYAHLSGVVNFVVAFIAIIPLAAGLSFATEELAMYVGETIGGLLNASFGNATELIVSIIALSQKKILIVQTSLIGSMLSNLLLVLGMCFFGGGITRVRQHFNITVAQTACSMLALSIGSLIIPTAFSQFGANTDQQRAQEGVAPISRGTSIILLLVYGSYLFFQLKTHAGMYNEPSKKGEKFASSKKEKGAVFHGMAHMGAGTAAMSGGQVNQENLVQRPDDDEEEEPTLSAIGALITLGFFTVLIAFCSEFLVSGIDSLTSKGVSEEFVGLILLPIVGNAAEHATAITVACKDKMDLAIGVAVGSSQQIALLVLPLMVVIGWCGLGAPEEMTLNFDGFQVAVLFIAVLLVNYLIQDGESHWLEGVLLMSTYIIIAVSAFFYPVELEGGAE